MQVDRMTEQRNDLLDNLPDEARAARIQAAGAAKAYSCTNFVPRASSTILCLVVRNLISTFYE